MNENELRVGNFVNLIADGHENEPDTFQWGIDDYEFYSDRMSFIKPIPLTEEWLEKFNFSRLDNEYWFNRDYPSYDLNLTGSFRRHYMDFDNDDSESFEIEDKNINIKYVHQLQNLYFALTGEELTLQK